VREEEEEEEEEEDESERGGVMMTPQTGRCGYSYDQSRKRRNC